MKTNIQLGRIWGIPIGLNISWFLIFGLVTMSLAMGMLPASIPGQAPSTYWLLAILTSLLFFGSVLAHELGHAYISLRNQIPVRRISLFLLGGVAEITSEPKSPGAEFRIAIAGPIVSLLLAAGAGLFYLVSRDVAMLAEPLLWLARINLILAFFNLIPGYPLDGGRVLRAILWWWRGDEFRSTQIAARIGQVVAYGFIGLGILGFFTGGLSNGIWLVFIGWYLNQMATASHSYAGLRRSLEGVTVSQVMQRSFPAVPPWLTVDQVVNETILGNGHEVVVVRSDERVYGLFTIANARSQNSRTWPFTQVAKVVTPIAQITTLNPDSDAFSALQQLHEKNSAYAVIVEQNRLLGLITPGHILRYARHHAQLRQLRPANAGIPS